MLHQYKNTLNRAMLPKGRRSMLLEKMQQLADLDAEQLKKDRLNRSLKKLSYCHTYRLLKRYVYMTVKSVMTIGCLILIQK